MSRVCVRRNGAIAKETCVAGHGRKILAEVVACRVSKRSHGLFFFSAVWCVSPPRYPLRTEASSVSAYGNGIHGCGGQQCSTTSHCALPTLSLFLCLAVSTVCFFFFLPHFLARFGGEKTGPPHIHQSLRYYLQRPKRKKKDPGLKPYSADIPRTGGCEP